jgi:hypothetical protein
MSSPKSCTFKFYLHMLPNKTCECLIQATNKQHAADLLRIKRCEALRNLHAFTKQTKQMNWPLGTLIVGKPIVELF